MKILVSSNHLESAVNDCVLEISVNTEEESKQTFDLVIKDIDDHLLLELCYGLDSLLTIKEIIDRAIKIYENK